MPAFTSEWKKSKECLLIAFEFDSRKHLLVRRAGVLWKHYNYSETSNWYLDDNLNVLCRPEQ